MSAFVIPKNTDFVFTFKLNAKDSFDPQDLTNVDSAVFELFEEENQTIILTKDCVVEDIINGIFSVNFTAAETDLLEVRRAASEDNYFLKVKYNATIVVSFSDETLPSSVFIREVFVTPSGE